LLSKPPLPPPAPEREHDRALLAGLRRADAGAFDALYEGYFSRIYSYFRRRLETVTEAEKATEAALTAVFQEISSAPSEVPLGRWIFGQVRGVALSRDGPAQESRSIKNLKVRSPQGGSLRSG
jgi:DNA-directed RNA polymerase specialized sigma24 family protein